MAAALACGLASAALAAAGAAAVEPEQGPADARAASGSPATARVLLQASPLAGFRHHGAPERWHELREGDALVLEREPDNPFDPRAIRVRWRDTTLGYVPRAANATLAWAIDRGERVGARIARLREHPNPRARVLIEVFAE